MGGAVGHLQHLYDDLDLSFKEMTDIILSASSGRLENVSEKLDGLNLVFSWDASVGSPRVARSIGDIKRGGMDSTALSAKFSNRGNLTETFNSAFKILELALGSLSKSILTNVFGTNANRWYSMEVISRSTPNVINYDYDAIVFHGWPTFLVKPDGTYDVVHDAERIKKLVKNVAKMQSAINDTGWKISGPSSVVLNRVSTDVTNSTISKISGVVKGTGLMMSATVRDYIKAMTIAEVRTLGLPKNVSGLVVLRCLEEQGYPTLVDINKIVDKSSYVAINNFVKSFPTRIKEFVRPFELAINDFAVELLRNTGSTFIVNHNAEVLRLREEVRMAIKMITASDNEVARSILATQIKKLGSPENITSPIEGIVFVYNETAYKFTGSFAAANQVLGLFKYGRGGTKLTTAA